MTPIGARHARMASIFAMQPDWGTAAVVRPCAVRAWLDPMSALFGADWLSVARPAWLGLLGQA